MSRVCVIGAGPSGLSALHAFHVARKEGKEVPEVVCFEKQKDIGGLWNYSWRTGLDEHGLPVHNSMYRFLWSNGPKECLELADYTFADHFPKPIPSFPPREVLRDYLGGRAEAEGLADAVKFEHVVTHVEWDAGANSFAVSVKDLNSDCVGTHAFSHVVVATGHFSTPHVPSYPGFETFPGRVLHAHDVRDMHEFSGKRILIVGSSYSAEDLALQSLKYGATSVTIAFRNNALGFKWPKGIEERKSLQKMEGTDAVFENGSRATVDVVLLCTGYRHHFPFLPDSLRLKTANVMYPPSLYKGVVWTTNPRLLYLGMQDQWYTFSMFDVQGFFALGVILGQIELPSGSDMEREIADWMEKEARCDGLDSMIDFQTEYLVDLCKAVNYPFKVDCAQIFKDWERRKHDDILTYRNGSFKSIHTQVQAPVHHTEWWKAMDDSMACFLAAQGEGQ